MKTVVIAFGYLSIAWGSLMLIATLISLPALLGAGTFIVPLRPLILSGFVMCGISLSMYLLVAVVEFMRFIK